MLNYEVGKEVFIVQSDSRDGRPTQAVITKVGRKYAYARRDQWGNECKIDISTDRTVVKIGSNAQVYESESAYIEAREARTLQHKIGKMLTGFGTKQQSLETLTSIAKLLSIDETGESNK